MKSGTAEALVRAYLVLYPVIRRRPFVEQMALKRDLRAEERDHRRGRS